VNRNLLLALLAWALVGIGRTSAASTSDILRLDNRVLPATELDAQVARLMKAAQVTGLGLVVVNDGKIVYAKAHGLKDRQKRAPLTEQSLMSGASLSKAVFAAMAMQLVEEGALDLDQPIERYLGRRLAELPNYRDLRSDERARRFTLRMLLSHTTGLPNWRRLTPDKKLSIHFEPGSRYAYSGEGIAIAQLVVERATGQSLLELIQARILARYGMTRTSYVWKREFASDIAVGHDEQEKPLGHRQWTEAGAAGSMDTCLADYAKFIEALLQGRVMKPASFEEMSRPQIEIFSLRQFPTLSTETTEENRGVGLAYGLGWGVLQRTPYGRALFKEGHDDGWEHYSICYPQTKTAVVILTNSSNGESIFKELLELVTGDTSVPWRWEGYTPYDEMK
jgi:CubicO group peptidase (beta-lactamase class C family)